MATTYPKRNTSGENVDETLRFEEIQFKLRKWSSKGKDAYRELASEITGYPADEITPDL